MGIEATLKQIETAQWHPMATRSDYQVGTNLTGIGVDDPDANFYENYACGSPRNYTGYCNEEVMKMIEQQSQEVDLKKRMRAGGPDPAEARAGRGPAGHGLAARLLPDGSLREEPGPAPEHLQLRPHAGRLAVIGGGVHWPVGPTSPSGWGSPC